jgi:hypothetical protein
MCIAAANFSNNRKIDLAVPLLNAHPMIHSCKGNGAFIALVLSTVNLPSDSILLGKSANPAAAIRQSAPPKLPFERRKDLRVSRQKTENTKDIHDRRTSCNPVQSVMPPHSRFGQ